MAGGKFKKFLRKIAPLAVGLIPGIGPIAGGLLKAGIGTLTAGMNARDAAREQQKAAAGRPGIASLMSGMGGMGGAPEAAAPASFTTSTASVNPYAAEGPASSYAAAPQGLRSLQPSQMNYGQNEQAMFNAPQQEPQQDRDQDYAYGGPVYLAQGGIAGLQQHEYAAGGQYLSGPGDGMSDNIRANIDGIQEARLATSEFVLPADVVSHIGNGSSEAGAKKLHEMMARIRKARTGNPKQGKQINPDKYLPA